jgi:hypothetical protein
MLEADFANAVPMAYDTLGRRSFLRRLFSRAAALTAPTL